MKPLDVPTAHDALMVRLIRLIETHRCPLTDEKLTQAALETMFLDAGLDVKREHRLSKSDIPDFYIDGIVVEVKIKGARAAIGRQLQRYATHETVTGVLLATAVSVVLPSVINGKPARAASLGRAWL